MKCMLRVNQELHFKKIADVKLVTTPTASMWGDKGLFFQHTRYEDDLKSHPELEEPLVKLVENQRSTPYYNGYDDIKC